MIARDVTGKELKVGQKVAHTERGGYRGLRVSKVLKVTPKMVVLDFKAYDRCEPMKREHGYVCIVEDVPMVCTCVKPKEACSACPAV